MKISLDEAGDVLVITVQGDVAYQAFRAALEELWCTPAYRCPRRLWDLRAARLGFATEEYAEIAKLFRGRDDGTPTRVAILVRRDVQFGLARMYSTLRESDAGQRRAFRDLDEALVWLRS